MVRVDSLIKCVFKNFIFLVNNNDLVKETKFADIGFFKSAKIFSE